MDFLTDFEKEREVIVYDNLITKENLDEQLTGEKNFSFTQQTDIKRRTRKGLIRIAIFAFVFIGIGILATVEFKPMYSITVIFFLFYTLHLGLLVTIIISLEEISTLYQKKRLSPTKLASVIGGFFGILMGILFGYAALQVELEDLPAQQTLISAFVTMFIIFTTMFLLSAQVIGLAVTYIMNISKPIMKIINIVILAVQVVSTFLFMFRWGHAMSDGWLFAFPFIFIFIDSALFIGNVLIFRKYAKRKIFVTPLRVIWLNENKVDYYRFKEIAKIEVGESKVILTIKGGFHVVKEIKLKSHEDNKEINQIFDSICQTYLTKAHTELRLERKLDTT
ncbi:MAG: hypothetical protein ACTSSH_03670 [Candidatus Heimdallarchaeota archaeon]